MNLYLSVILIFLCCLFSMIELITRRSYKIFLIILIPFFVYIISTRYIYSFPDTIAYITAYKNLNVYQSWSPSAWDRGGFEYGYVLLSLAARKLGLNYRDFFAVIAAIQVVVYLTAIRKFTKGGGGHYLYCVYFSIWAGYWGIYYAGLVLRSGLAISFMFLAHACLRYRQISRAIIFSLVAYSFHRLIIVYPVVAFTAYFLHVRRRTTFLLWLVVIMLMWVLHMEVVFYSYVARFIDALISDSEVFSRYSLYVSGNDTISVIGKRAPFVALILIMTKPEQDEYYYGILNMYMLNLTLTLIVNAIPVGYRIHSICQIFMLPLLYNYLTKSKAVLLEKLLMCVMMIIWQFISTLVISGTY